MVTCAGITGEDIMVSSQFSEGIYIYIYIYIFLCEYSHIHSHVYTAQFREL